MSAGLQLITRAHFTALVIHGYQVRKNPGREGPWITGPTKVGLETVRSLVERMAAEISSKRRRDDRFRGSSIGRTRPLAAIRDRQEQTLLTVVEAAVTVPSSRAFARLEASTEPSSPPRGGASKLSRMRVVLVWFDPDCLRFIRPPARPTIGVWSQKVWRRSPQLFERKNHRVSLAARLLDPCRSDVTHRCWSARTRSQH